MMEPVGSNAVIGASHHCVIILVKLTNVGFCICIVLLDHAQALHAHVGHSS